MNGSLPEIAPPPPYCDADVTWTSDGFRIDFAQKDPYRLRRRLAVVATVAGGTGLILTSTSAGLLTGEITWAWSLFVIGVCLLIVALACLMTVLITSVRSAIVFDGELLSIGVPARRFTGYRFPLEAIQGLRLHLAAKAALDLHFNAPRGQRLARRTPCHLEVVTPEGVVRVLSNWREQDVRWAAGVVNAALGLRPLPDRDDAKSGREPARVEKGWTMPTKYRWQIGVCCGIFVVLLLLWMGSDLRHLSRMRSWSTAPGVVEVVELVGSGDRQRLELEYRYDVGAKTYTGDRLSFSTSHPEQTSFARQHRPGSPVTVYYNPADPSDAVLDRDKPLLDWLVQGGLLLFVLLPFLWAVHGGGGAGNRELVRKYGAVP